MTIVHPTDADTRAGDLRYQQRQTESAGDDLRRRAAERVVLPVVVVGLALWMAAVVWSGII
jgi:hypothetical protein